MIVQLRFFWITILLTWGLGALAHGGGQHGVAKFVGKQKFTENKGQWVDEVKFEATMPNGKLWLENNAFYYFLYHEKETAQISHPGQGKGEMVSVQGHAYKTTFRQANSQVRMSGANPSTHYFNYFIGKDSKRWVGKVKQYEQVVYESLYKGIDLKVYATEQVPLKYDFIVSPQADVHQIALQIDGADALRLKNKALQIVTSVGTIVEQKPYAYQIVNDKQIAVDCDYVLQGNVLTFSFPKSYNKNLSLIVDPSVVFATYTGATADNWGYTATYDNHGAMYVGGYVNAFPPNGSFYPTTLGAFQTTWGGGTGGNSGNGNGIAFACDMGISKFSADGTQLVYSTFIGGTDNETPHSLVVDNVGNLIIYGVSYSADYPTSFNAYDKTINGLGDIVVTKLTSDGGALLGSTFIGGSADDGINFDPGEFTSGKLKRNYGDQNRGEVNIDLANNIYVASCTKSLDYPVTVGALQNTFGGLQDGCVFKLNADCSQLIYSTFLGGSDDDACYSLDLGSNGTLYVAGGTMSNNFPITAGALNTTYRGGLYDGFLAHINMDGTQLLQSSYIGTSGNDQVYFVKLDNLGDVYCVGQTTGQYPVFNAPYANPNSGQFILKINPSLSTSVYSTVFGNGGGLPNISPTAFLVDTCQNVYVAGWGTNSGSFAGFANSMFNMPLTSDALKTTTDGTDFYFFVLSKNAQNILYGSYFGGNGAIEHVDGGTSRFDKRGVIYQAMCAGCGGNSLTPTTAGVWSPSNPSNNCNLLGLKLEFNLAGVAVEIDAFPRATGCVPLTVQFDGTITNAVSYLWNFGDGNTSMQQSPLHTYTDTGTYTVMLVGIDPNSCNVSDTAYLEVVVRDDSLSANFLPDLVVDCDSNKVALAADNFATTKYDWAMGDGATYSTTSVSHYYNAPGKYTIRLIVSDTSKCNLIDTFQSLINIPEKIDATIGLNTANGCIPLPVSFVGGGLPTSSYSWSFGDGDISSLKNPTHVYTTEGQYTVRLIVADSNSCDLLDTAFVNVTVIDSSANAQFNFSRTFYGCDSVDVTVWSVYQGEDFELWDFGDGTTATTDTATHRYTQAGSYIITHYLIDSQQICQPIDTFSVVISLEPLNAFPFLPDTGGCLPFNATFIGNSQLNTTNYIWHFGDGASAVGDTVSHLYNAVGVFTVMLLAADTNACVGLDTSYATVEVIDDFVTASFNVAILNDCDSLLQIDLLNNSVNASTYWWDFGDGTFSSNVNETHEYTLPGTYTITLMVEDTNRCHPRDTFSRVVRLKPNSVIDFEVSNVCSGTQNVFTNLSHPNAQFTWQFGDGTISTLYSPTHTYLQPNTYSVRLTMVDTSTCNVFDTLVKTLEVYPQPIAGFNLVNDTFRFETPVHFSNNSIRYDNLLWSFGDGDTSSETNPVHTYTTIHQQTVCVRAYNEVCDDTFCRTIFILFDALIGVPNAFSPNGDGINDVVKLEGKGIVKLVFRIYNRWGEKVFETTDQTIGWDGVYKGVLQEMEVYTYAAEATMINGKTIPLKGNITLLR
jgi:gliding motility-associated-like protein